MEFESTRAFKIIRERREAFDEALRILLGESYDKSFESWRATRELAVIVASWEDEFDDKTPRGADGYRLSAEGRETKFSSRKPPRAAEAHQLLAQVEDASRVLRKKIEKLNGRLAIYTDLVLPSPLTDSQLSEILHKSQVYGAVAGSDLNESEFYRNLLALEEYCRIQRNSIPTDRGGRANLDTMLLGNPKARFVNDASQLFVEFRPGIISSNPEKSFYKFVGALYEVLTGQEPEGPGAGLKKYVEFVAPRMRKVEVISARRLELFFARQAGSLNADEERELVCLERESAALHEELLTGPQSAHAAS